MTVKLENADYDFYKVMIPLSKMFGKRRENYVWNELEKKHPCFSNRDAVDCKFHLGTKGVFANLTVAEKTVLLDYKSKYPKAMFVTEEEKNVFSPRKTMAFLVAAGIILFCAICSIVKINHKKIQVSVNTENVNNIEPVVKKTEPETSAAEEIFRILGNEKEIIRDFEWKFVKEIESCRLSLSDTDPFVFLGYENLNNNETNIEYSKGKPLFTLNVSKKIPSEEIRGCPPEERKAFIKCIREHLSENGSVLLSESFGENGAFYRVSLETPDLSFLQDQEQNPVFTASEFDVSSMKISSSDNGSFICSMEFNDSYTSPFKNRISEIISQKTFLFVHENKKLKDPEKVKKEKSVAIKEVKSGSRKKIGVITHGDNQGIVFYKNEKGRIVSENEIEK